MDWPRKLRLRPLWWLRKALDCTRAGDRIVQSTILPRVFAAPEAYRREGKSGGYIAMKLNKTLADTADNSESSNTVNGISSL